MKKLILTEELIKRVKENNNFTVKEDELRGWLNNIILDNDIDFYLVSTNFHPEETEIFKHKNIMPILDVAILGSEKFLGFTIFNEMIESRYILIRNIDSIGWEFMPNGVMELNTSVAGRPGWRIRLPSDPDNIERVKSIIRELLEIRS